MIDDDDVDFAILAWPTGGWLAFVIGLVVVVVLSIIAHYNTETCEAKTCVHGKGALVNHECVCLEKPVD
jgi:hypothetical protein